MDSQADARIFLETLRLTKADATTWTYEISSNSRTTIAVVREALSRMLGRDVVEQVELASGERIKLASSAARARGLLDATRILDWIEFERYAEECLRESNFATEGCVRVKTGKKLWEVD